MAHGALPANLGPHLGQTIRTTRSFWRTPRGIILLLFISTLLFYLADPFHTRNIIRRQEPRQVAAEVRQKVLEKLNANGGDPLTVDPQAPGTNYVPASVHGLGLGKAGRKHKDHSPKTTAAKSDESKGPLPESKLYPDEWEAIEQAQDSIRKQEVDNRLKKEEAARKKEEEQQTELRKGKEDGEEEKRRKFAASAEKHGGEAARKSAEAANPRKDRDKRPERQKETNTTLKEKLRTSQTEAATNSSENRLSVKLDKDNSGAHDHPEAPPASHHNNLTSTLVLGRLAGDFLKVVWIHNEVRSLTNKRVYIVDDPTAEYHLKRNKGREAMVYLRYILDFYDQYDDVTLFYHPSRESWHNSVLLNRDAAIMINNLNRSHVMDVGYMNARCELYPGCTGTDEGWIKFNPTREQHLQHWERNADLFTTKLWDKLFPDRHHDPISLSEPCCSQFAVSRETLMSWPKSTYQRIHDWLGTTEEIDGYTGRIMEYMWQYLFLRKDAHCPNMRDCYCKGYGLCLNDEGAALLQEYNDVRAEIDNVLMKLEREDKENGCDDIDLEKEPARHEQCIQQNVFLLPLNQTRTRKSALEKLLPTKYGILRPEGKAGDGLGNATGILD